MASIGLSVVTVVSILAALRSPRARTLAILLTFWTAYALVDLLSLGVIG